MSPRHTGSGYVLENMILPALQMGGYQTKTQELIGLRLGGRKHIVDAIAQKEEKEILISVKWQHVSGTAEQKVPFEVMCLIDAYKTGRFEKVYLVLGGIGWTLRDFFISEEFKHHIVGSESIIIIKFEEFIGIANQGKL